MDGRTEGLRLLGFPLRGAHKETCSSFPFCLLVWVRWDFHEHEPQFDLLWNVRPPGVGLCCSSGLEILLRTGRHGPSHLSSRNGTRVSDVKHTAFVMHGHSRVQATKANRAEERAEAACPEEWYPCEGWREGSCSAIFRALKLQIRERWALARKAIPSRIYRHKGQGTTSECSGV